MEGNLHYDDNGNLLTTSDDQIQAGALYSFSYDPQNRVDDVTAEYLPGSTDPVLDSRYDAFGNRTQLAAADATGNFDHTWRFDAFDRLDEAVLPGGANPTVKLAYNGRDDVTTITRRNATPADHVQSVLSYFDTGPVDTITVTDLLPASAQCLLLDYGTPDATLNVTSQSESRDGATAQATSYGYDDADRLTLANYPTSAFGLPTTDDSFSYDDAGNRDDAGSPGSFSYNVNNQIQASPGRGYVFDEDGNLLAITDGATPTPNPIADLTWDYANRLQSYEVAASDLIASYRYDPFGRRIQKTVDPDGAGSATPTTTWYLWDGDRLLAEYDASGDRQVRYAYAGGFAPIQVARKNGPGEDVYDVHSDHLDTPRLLTDANGAAAWRASYEAYGKAALDGGNTFAFNVRFPGQYYDAETETAGTGSGMHDNRFRTYDPTTGRYISADPIGQAGGINIYAYARSNAANLIDPFGLIDFGGVINAQIAGKRPPSPPSAPAQTVGAVGDLVGNYFDMRSANTVGADKYFHCKANCEAAQRGETGEDTAEVLSDAREAFDENIKGDSPQQCQADQAANQAGRQAGAQSRNPSGSGPPSQSCASACAQYRPSGLPPQF